MVKYARNNKIISGRLSDEMVMMSVEQGRYFSLNNVATRIWDLLDKPLTLPELCSLLGDEYDIDPDRCLNEVSDHLDEMVKSGLIIRKDD